MANLASFDPNLATYHYVSKRVLAALVAQRDAGKSRWRPRGVNARAPFVPLGLDLGKQTDLSPFSLVRGAEDFLDFGTLPPGDAAE
jgi:hypothetical protein